MSIKMGSEKMTDEVPRALLSAAPSPAHPGHVLPLPNPVQILPAGGALGVFAQQRKSGAGLYDTPLS